MSQIKNAADREKYSVSEESAAPGLALRKGQVRD
tara:strand:- start:5040 stop:5141 length:102 start_codon:yes stop_codon:yes gene_type:complete